ncbi:MAG: DUF72 domain-containing protein [Myxococcota bacterium]
MVFVACSGFPVPVSRYFDQFGAVEISDTELGMPGEGTIRRWLREAPEGFAFSMLAPKEIGASGFEISHDVREAVGNIGRLALRVHAKAVVFAAPPSIKPTAKRRAALGAFLDWLPDNFPPIVLDLPAWKPEQVVDASDGRPVVVAHDPLNDAPPKDDGGLCYLRMPGPAGYRSRYDDETMDDIAARCRQAEAHYDTVMCVFRNIDMHANALQLMERLS